MPKWWIEDWKKNLRRGDIISVALPGDLNKFEKQKYRPAIVIKNNFDENLPVQSLDVQMLTALSNWKDDEKGKNIGESFQWNYREQYMQQFNFKKISYGVINSIYYGDNEYGEQETRFEDDHIAMKLIRKLHKCKNWDDLNPNSVLWTLKEQQLQEEYLNELSSQQSKKDKKLQQTILEQQKTIVKEQETTAQLTKENKNLKKEITYFKKTVSKEQQRNSELNDLKLKFEQEIDDLKETISKQKQEKNELNKCKKRKQKDLNQQIEKNKKLQQKNDNLNQTILEQQKNYCKTKTNKQWIN